MDAKKLPTPDQIAKLITEDIGYNNGLINELERPGEEWVGSGAEYKGWRYNAKEAMPSDKTREAVHEAMQEVVKRYGQKLFARFRNVPSAAPEDIRDLTEKLGRGTYAFKIEELDKISTALGKLDSRNEAQLASDIYYLIEKMKAAAGKAKAETDSYKLYAARQGVGKPADVEAENPPPAPTTA